MSFPCELALDVPYFSEVKKNVNKMHKCTQPLTKHKLEIPDEHARNQKMLAIHFC